MPQFAQSSIFALWASLPASPQQVELRRDKLRQKKILILEILNIFLRLKFFPSLTLNKLKHFETASSVMEFIIYSSERV